MLDKSAPFTKELDNLIDQIVAELMDDTRLYIYEPKRGGYYVRYSANQHILPPVTNEDLQKFPEELRPQLTGNLMKIDISEPSYKVLLSHYKSEAEIQEELNRVVEEGTMAISINVNPVFSDGASEGTLEIENVPSNKYAQVVSITLDDSGKEIYNSGLIQPNYHIQTDKLSEALAAGTYDCTATFTAYDTSDSENPIEVGSAAAKITISVLS